MSKGMGLETSSLEAANLRFDRASLTSSSGMEFALTDEADGARLAVLAPADSRELAAFEGETSDLAGQSLLVGPPSAGNAAALRDCLPWLHPRPLGLKTSAGMGDRLGLATPGHVRALQSVGGTVAPIFAQQSMREMGRTARSPQQVLDDATWGAFAAGWHGDLGADADHLKNCAEVDVCLAAGFTFFTIDPGSYVINEAETAGPERLRELDERLPADVKAIRSGLRGRRLQAEEVTVVFDEATLLRCAVKYGAAVAHVAALYRHLERAAGSRPFEVEVSVDETDQPTTHAQHIYLTHELKRLGVRWLSLAPRFVGRFEKGVDYIGDVGAFEKDIAGHAAIARAFGPYKLSLHSGSDKFSIYPLAMRETRGMVHLKTAGTSYLEALRTIAHTEPGLLREIYTFARSRYAVDRLSYHVSAEPSRAPTPQSVSDWPGLLEQFDAREILHVTYGSVVALKAGDGESELGSRLRQALHRDRELYAQNLERHFVRHLRPFARGGETVG